MYKLKEIADKVYYVGVNDRQKALFENMWPLPYGVSYNSYLIVDEKTVLIDTVDVCYSDIFLKKVADALDGRSLDYLVVNHMEPDHAGSVEKLLEINPTIKVVGSATAITFLQHIVNRDFYSVVVDDGDTLSLGDKTIRFYSVPSLHWPDTIYSYIEEDGVS